MARVHGFVEKLATLCQAGQAFVSVTMVDARGSVPQEVGSKMLVDHSGLLFGTVGGGKIEQQAIAYAQSMLASPADQQNTKIVEWNLKRDVGMTCGGTVQLFFEAYNHRIWQIVIFGAGHVSSAIVRCLLNIDCRITVVDSREEWLGKLPESSSLTKICMSVPQEYVVEIPTQAMVLVMTMGHRTDMPILEAILKRKIDLGYLGAIGSRGKRAALRKELMAAGLTEVEVQGFRCPIGLPLGSNEPGEIAISVVAELLQVRDQLRSACVSDSRQ